MDALVTAAAGFIGVLVGGVMNYFIQRQDRMERERSEAVAYLSTLKEELSLAQRLASLRTEMASAQDFLRHCDAMPRSERRLYGTRAKEVQDKATNLQRKIDKLSLAEGWQVDILRERAQKGLAILLEP